VFRRLCLLFSLLSIQGISMAQESIETIAERLAQEQLEAYNNHDAEAFVMPYAENVKVYNFPDQLLYE
jgi:hypothetical protein